MRTLRLAVLLLCLGMVSCAGYLTFNPSRITRIIWLKSEARIADSLWAWSEKNGVESAVCTYGMVNIPSTTVYVTRIERPTHVENVTINSIFVFCKARKDFLGIEHTHLDGSGMLSVTDSITVNTDPFYISTIICGPTCRVTYKRGSMIPIEKVR